MGVYLVQCLGVDCRLLKSAAWVAIVVIGSACAPIRGGRGCGPNHEAAEGTAPKAAPTNPLREARLRLYEGPTRPSTDNTGPYDVAALVSTGALKISSAGTVYEDIDVKGDIWIDADDVTIRNFRIDAAGNSTVSTCSTAIAASCWRMARSTG